MHSRMTARERLIGKPLIGFDMQTRPPAAMVGGAEVKAPPTMVGLTEAPRAMVGEVQQSIRAPSAMVGEQKVDPDR